MLYLNNEPGRLSLDVQRALQAVDGWLYLGLADEAIRELNAVSVPDQIEAPLLRARIRALLHLKRWKEAEVLSEKGCELHPDENEFTVQRAFALHQQQRGHEAADVILSAPDWIRRTGILHYNLACYEAKLGDLGTARQCIRTALEMNAGFRKNARTDPDLVRLWS
jgi:tetratricopeptide (TPR) repeat protein